MIRTFDCHIHTRFSQDARQTMEEACERAVSLGLDAVCFTEHQDFDETYRDFYDPEAYFAELERMRERYDGRLRILAGLEFEELTQHLPELEQAQKRSYDFILGSVHCWIGDLFASQIAELGLPLERVYELYWEEILKMVRCGGFDAVAHLDFPKRYMGDALWYDPAVLDEIFGEMRKRGLVLEINTSSLRKGCREAMPGEALLRRYKANGGEYVTLGSDAHYAEDIYADVPQASETAQAAGLRPVCFVGRKIVKAL